jgi:hypothetical protein
LKKGGEKGLRGKERVSFLLSGERVFFLIYKRGFSIHLPAGQGGRPRRLHLIAEAAELGREGREGGVRRSCCSCCRLWCQRDDDAEAAVAALRGRSGGSSPPADPSAAPRLDGGDQAALYRPGLGEGLVLELVERVGVERRREAAKRRVVMRVSPSLVAAAVELAL